MSQDDLAGFDPGALFDVPREDGADGALVEADVPESVTVHGGLRLEPIDDCGFRYDDENVRVAGRAMALHRSHDLLARNLNLRNDDEVGPASEAAVRGDPARVPTHRLDHDDAMVRARRRAQAIERVRDHRDRSVETDAVIRFGKVVVNGLRHTDHADALLVQPLRDSERVVATDRDERVDPPAPDAFEHRTPRRIVSARIGA